MAVALTITYPPGTTTRQYDQILKRLDIDAEGSHDNGALFHWVEERGDTLVVHDVWESREEFDSFVSDILAPVAQEVGMGEPVSIEETQVYNYLQG